MTAHSASRIVQRLVIIATALPLSLPLSGCTGSMLTDAGGLFGQVDQNDVCGAEHAELADANSFFTRSVIQGAMTGAIIGGLGGLLAGKLGGKDAGKSAAYGALTGGALGGIGGYFAARQKQAADQQALASQVWDDLQAENQQIDRATLTFIKVKNCRFQAAERTKANFRSGAITRDEAQRHLQDQKTRFEQEITIAREMGARMMERQQEYRFAADELRQTAAPDLPPSSAIARPLETRAPGVNAQRPAIKPASTRELAREVNVAATQTNVQKRNAFESEVARGEAAKEVVFAVSGPSGPSPSAS